MPFTVNHSCYEDHNTRKDIITLEFKNQPDVDEVDKKSYKEFYIDNHKDLEQNKTNFKLKIKCLGRHNEILEFYYLYPKPIYLKHELKVYNTRKRSTISSVTDEKYHEIQSNKWEYLGTTSLQNECSLFLLTYKFTFHTITNIVPLEDVPKRDLCNDFQNLLDSGLFSDVIIKSSEGTEFNVHKVILASRSTVLKAHFDHNTLECQTNIVESPLETETLSEVLTFIYSDKSPRVDEIPEKLLAAAEFYQLDKLKHLCEQALQEKLSVDNVFETLELAELHSARMLKNWTLEFITHGHTKDITKTEGWDKIKSIDLIKSIYEYIMNGNDGVEEK